MLAAVASAPDVAAQAPTDTLAAFVVGRTETAEVRITWARAVADSVWVPEGSSAPVAPGGGRPVQLTTTLPLRLGGADIPAGVFELRLAAQEGGAQLVVVEVERNAAGESVREAVYAQVRLRSMPLVPPRPTLQIHLRSQRHADDTIRVVTQSTATVNRVIKEIVPGTTWTLSLELGSRAFSIAVAAR